MGTCKGLLYACCSVHACQNDGTPHCWFFSLCLALFQSFVRDNENNQFTRLYLEVSQFPSLQSLTNFMIAAFGFTAYESESWSKLKMDAN